MSRLGRLERALPAVGLALLVLSVWRDPVFTGRTFTGRDNIAYNLPVAKVVHDSYASGRLPIWNPYISGGRPLAPNPNHDALYPLRALLSPLPFPAAMRLFPVLHWIAGGIGMLLLLGRLGVSRAGSFVGAATLVFSGPSVSEVFYPHLQPGFTLFPWIVWALVGARRASSTATLVVGLLFGLEFLAGDVFTGALALAIGVLWVALETPREERRSRLVAIAFALALGIGVGLPQILATALWVPETNRAVLGIDFGNAFRYSLSPFRLLELVVPYAFGHTWELAGSNVWGWSAFNGKGIGFFCTIFAGALAPIAVLRLRGRPLPGLRFARWLLAVSLVAAILPSLTPRSWLSFPSPLPLRNPEKLVVASIFALAIFAGHGFDELSKKPLARRVAIGIGALLAAASLVAALAPRSVGSAAAALWGTERNARRVASVQIPGDLAEAGLLWMATVGALALARSSGRNLRRVAVLGLCLVPIAATRRGADLSNTDDALRPTPLARRIRRWDPSGSFRTLGEAVYSIPGIPSPLDSRYRSTVFMAEVPSRDWFMYTQAFWGIGTVLNVDFDTGDFARVEGLRKVSAYAAESRDSVPFFGNLSLRWAVRTPERPLLGPYREAAAFGMVRLDVLDSASPDIRLATRWREDAGSLDALRALPGVALGELLIETGRSRTGTARPGTIRVLEKSPERLRVDYEAPDDTWLFVLRDFWRHRSVTVDGQPVEPVPAYLAFSAIPAPAGRHQVDWRERLPGWSLSAWAPPLALLVFLWVRVRERDRARPPKGVPAA
jgi:hypothetical protein